MFLSFGCVVLCLVTWILHTSLEIMVYHCWAQVDNTANFYLAMLICILVLSPLLPLRLLRG